VKRTDKKLMRKRGYNMRKKEKRKSIKSGPFVGFFPKN
jgi:hypothetical protein